ncbi:MAG: hypothetical protein Phyf2KO_01030 [Phycisphaerales bacterium]
MITHAFAPRALLACGVSFFSQLASGQSVYLDKVAQIKIADATEIVCYDQTTQRAVVTIGEKPEVAVIAIDENGEPSVERVISFADVGAAVNSVAASHGLFAAAVESFDHTDSGSVVFFDVYGDRVRVSRVGSMPDMVIFSPGGSLLLVANEGEPDAASAIDPIGSVSIIDINNEYAVDTIPLGSDRPSHNQTWFTMPGRLAPELVEPEYIAVSSDSTRAYVLCQENNAVFELDLAKRVITDQHWLGIVEWGGSGKSIDIVSGDGTLQSGSESVVSLRQPDAILAFETTNGLRLVTANEGDPRDVWGSDGAAKHNGVQVVKSSAESGLKPVLFGSRGITLFDDRMVQLDDSGDVLEKSIAALHRAGEIDDETISAIDSRSGKRGIEPESLATGVVDGRRFMFVGLERAGMIATFEYDEHSDSLTHISTFPVGVMAGQEPAMVSPEGLAFVGLDLHSYKLPFLIVCDELHGTVSILSVSLDND